MATQTPPTALSCFVVDDSAPARQLLLAALQDALPVPLRVLGWSEDARGGLTWLNQPHAACDLVVINLFLAAGHALGLLQQTRRHLPRSRVVVLAPQVTADLRHRCLRLGADHVFDKCTELESFLAFCVGLVDVGRLRTARPARPVAVHGLPPGWAEV